MLNVPWKEIQFPVFTHKPGTLVVAQDFFEITELFRECRRVYWIVNDTNKPIERGGHYHPCGGKQEILVCVVGSAIVSLHAAEACGNVTLDQSNKGVVIRAETWHKVLLAPGAVLLAIASTLLAPDEAVSDLRCGRH